MPSILHISSALLLGGFDSDLPQIWLWLFLCLAHVAFVALIILLQAQAVLCVPCAIPSDSLCDHHHTGYRKVSQETHTKRRGITCI
jgi:hypothetical protein